MTTEAKQLNHYGMYIQSDVPTGGVVQINEVNQEFLNDIMMNGINTSFEAFKDELGEDRADEFEEQPDDEILVGYYRDEVYKDYKEDPAAPFSCIILGDTIHITNSTYVVKGAPCSPCCPGQVSIGEQGEYLAYSLPAEAYIDAPGRSENAIPINVYVYRPRAEKNFTWAKLAQAKERLHRLRVNYIHTKCTAHRDALQAQSSYVMRYRQYFTELGKAEASKEMIRQRCIW